MSGPCPVNALRHGDVGHKDDVDAFYGSLNAYVRYFYEDDESGWGFSPFRQFRYYLISLNQYLLMLCINIYSYTFWTYYTAVFSSILQTIKIFTHITASLSADTFSQNQLVCSITKAKVTAMISANIILL